MNNDEPVKPFLYKTTQRGLAAALMASGFALLETSRANGVWFFTFAVSHELLEAADQFWRDELAVSANRMAGCTDFLDQVVDGQKSVNDFYLNGL